jgi:hypothetical protein
MKPLGQEHGSRCAIHVEQVEKSPGLVTDGHGKGRREKHAPMLDPEHHRVDLGSPQRGCEAAFQPESEAVLRGPVLGTELENPELPGLLDRFILLGRRAKALVPGAGEHPNELDPFRAVPEDGLAVDQQNDLRTVDRGSAGPWKRLLPDLRRSAGHGPDGQTNGKKRKTVMRIVSRRGNGGHQSMSLFRSMPSLRA